MPSSERSRQHVSSGAPWEPVVGYSRAVRAGDTVYVSGTASVDAEGRIGPVGDPYGQAVQALRIIERALREAGAALADVVRTRIYLRDMAHWQEVGRAHGELFRDVRPATTLIAVSDFIDPEILVEIEAEAVIGAGS